MSSQIQFYLVGVYKKISCSSLLVLYCFMPVPSIWNLWSDRNIICNNFKHMQKYRFESFYENLPIGDIKINCRVKSSRLAWKLYPITRINLKVKRYFLFGHASTLLLSKYIVDRQKQALFTFKWKQMHYLRKECSPWFRVRIISCVFQNPALYNIFVLVHCMQMFLDGACQNIFSYLRCELLYLNVLSHHCILYLEYYNNYNHLLVLIHKILCISTPIHLKTSEFVSSREETCFKMTKGF